MLTWTVSPATKSVKPLDVLAVAKGLAAAGSVETREARGRSAVSRAYYSVYHEALAYCSDMPPIDVSAVRGGVHAQLFAKLDGLVEKLPPLERGFLLKVIASFELLRDWRVEADYSISEAFNPVKPLQAIDFAERIFRQLKQCRPSSQAPSSAA